MNLLFEMPKHAGDCTVTMKNGHMNQNAKINGICLTARKDFTISLIHI